MQKIRVAVLRGGLSDEYDVSLLRGAAVLENINTEKYEPIDVIISRGGEWIVEGRTKLPEQILQSVDIVFIALHGTYGEDGTLQRLLDRYNVRYTGSRAYSSGIAMNKATTKGHLRDTHVKLPQHVTVTRDSLKDISRITENIVETFGPKYVLKPVSSGSSVGTIIIENPASLSRSISDALDNFDEVMVEELVSGREASCGVIERFRDQEHYALPPIEIIVPETSDFFDNKAKYSGGTDEICPSTFDRDTKKTIEDLAVFIHKTIGLSQYSRSDFIVNDAGVYFLEVNTLPGLTTESLLPKEISAVGGTYSDFITHLLTDSMTSFR